MNFTSESTWHKLTATLRRSQLLEGARFYHGLCAGFCGGFSGGFSRGSCLELLADLS